MNNSTFVRLMLSIPVVAGLLIGGCSAAAHGAELVCTSRQLANGRVGERVTTCVAAAPAQKMAVRRLAGTTTLYHARNGRLVAAR